jgi:hypothetical protein
MNKLPKTALGTEMSSEKEGLQQWSINHCFNKASGIDRKDLIQYKFNSTSIKSLGGTKIYFVIQQSI